jgi:hypothetical protein
VWLREPGSFQISRRSAKLPADQLARFRRWFTAFEAGRTDHAEELDSAATKLGRLAGRAFVASVPSLGSRGGKHHEPSGKLFSTE